jgi:hypothetical protein
MEGEVRRERGEEGGKERREERGRGEDRVVPCNGGIVIRSILK